LLSHFQLGGIHGLPYESWNGVDGSRDDNVNADNQWRGYCTHGMVTFPTWHRVYVALYEQVLQKHATDIARTYAEGVRDQFMTAAENLRAPFWDWASNSVPPPEVISLEKLTIIGSDGNKMTISNPLLRYTFHPIHPSFSAPYSNWGTTLRHPKPPRSPGAKSNVAKLEQVMRAEQDQITQQIYYMLTRLHTWPDFSNHTAGEGDPANSLESIHDGIHVNVGGGGHMSNAGVAGFDPIFFLHHANIDRMLSLWRALHPNVWVTPGSSVGGTWTIPINSTVDASTDLTPFRMQSPGFWASSMTTSTSKLGYTYPEFNGLDLGDANKVRAAIATKVDQLYGDTVFGASFHSAVDVQPIASESTTVSAFMRGGQDNADQSPDPSSEPLQPEVSSVTLDDWVARVRVKKYELDSSFSILFFLGGSTDAPEDVSDWRLSPGYVGGHHVFVNTAAEQCSNCRTQRELVVEGYVHLNRAIARNAPTLGSFEPADIVPYLKENLQWRAQKNDGTAAALDELPSLSIIVGETPLTLSAPIPISTIPRSGETRFYPEITAGR
jgi:tyrosinase